MFKMIKLVSFLVIAVITLALGGESAYAAYTTPKKISNTANDTVLPQLVTDNLGYIHTVWMEADPDWSSPNAGIFYSRWNGDSWSGAQKISANTTGFADSASLAADSLRRIHAVYADDTGFPAGKSRVRYTRRNTDGSWIAPEIIPHPDIPTLDWGWNPKIAVDANGVLHVIYVVWDNSNAANRGFYHTSNNGAGWSSPSRLSYETDGTTPVTDTQWSDLYADKQGNVQAIYWSWSKGILYRKLSGGSWSLPFSVTPATDVEYTRLTVDDEGDPWVIWFQTRDDSVKVRGQSAGQWQGLQTLITGAKRSWWGYPILGITTNSDGVISAGWGMPGAGDTTDIVYRLNAGGTWGNPESVRTGTINSDTPWFFRDLWDNQHLIWTEQDASEKWDLYYSTVQGTQQTVGTAGGTVVANPGGTTYVTLDFANDAFLSDTLVTVLIGPLPESIDPNVVSVPRAFTFGPAGKIFAANKRPTITFNYNVAELSGGDPSTLQAYVWDSQTSSYSGVSGQVNTQKKELKITTLDHFSLFGVAARAVRTEFLEPAQKRTTIGENATLPIRFKLSYLDNGENLTPGEVSAAVYNTQGNAVSPIYPLDEDEKNSYRINISAHQLNLSVGRYSLKVFRSEVMVGTLEFEVV